MECDVCDILNYYITLYGTIIQVYNTMIKTLPSLHIHVYTSKCSTIYEPHNVQLHTYIQVHVFLSTSSVTSCRFGVSVIGGFITPAFT